MGGKKKVWTIFALLVLVLISGVAFVLFSQQTFLAASTRFILPATPNEQTRSFYFDDYELRATARNGYYAPTGCHPVANNPPCGSCKDLGVDSYGCPQKSCQIPKGCEVKCRSYRCSWTSYFRRAYKCGNFKCWNWESETVKARRWQEEFINNCEYCGTSTEGSGGMQMTNVNGCVSKFDLYYKGNKIYDFTGSLNDGYSRDTVQIRLRNGVVNPESQQVITVQGSASGELPPPLQHDLTLFWGSKESRSDGSCVEVTGEIMLSPPADAVVAHVKEVPNHLIAGQYANTTLTITNSWRLATGTLYLDYIVPTLVGNATKTESFPITLPVGVSTIDVSIPTKQVTDTVLVRPRLDLSVDISQWTNVLSFDRSGEPAIVPLGQIEENWTAIQIVPKPLYIIKPIQGCYGDYVNSLAAPGYCMLNTIKELTCYQIGCPQIDIGGKEITGYECTSSGICAQTIFVEKKCTTDASCGRTDLKCDVGSGLCIQEKIFENILQCQENTDCPNPCNGKIASCAQNKCVYAGECEIIKLPPEVIEKIVEKTLPAEIRIQREYQKEIRYELTQCMTSKDCPTPCKGKTMSCAQNKCTTTGECSIEKTQSVDEKGASAGVLLGITLFLLMLVIGVIIAKSLRQNKR